MIPLKDVNPPRTVPFVNYTIVAMNGIVFFWELLLGRHLPVVFHHLGFVPSRFFHGGNLGILHPFRYLPLLTSMFLHGGFLHFLGNMWTLWIFGDNVEDRVGHFRYLLFYLSCGIFAGLTHAVFNPYSTLPSIGASGAIAGVMGAYLIYFPFARIYALVPIFFFIQVLEVPAVLFLGFWFFLQFFSGSLALTGSFYQAGGVAWWAHVGGFVAGILLGVMFHRRKKVVVFW